MNKLGTLETFPYFTIVSAWHCCEDALLSQMLCIAEVSIQVVGDYCCRMTSLCFQEELAHTMQCFNSNTKLEVSIKPWLTFLSKILLIKKLVPYWDRGLIWIMIGRKIAQEFAFTCSQYNNFFLFLLFLLYYSLESPHLFNVGCKCGYKVVLKIWILLSNISFIKEGCFVLWKTQKTYWSSNCILN